jgi:hypothetical protein
MSRSAHLGYQLEMSGIISTLLYIFWSWLRDWRNFNVLVLLGLIGITILGIALLVRQRDTKFQMPRIHFVASVITSIGMLGITMGLAWWTQLPGVYAWIYAFALSPLLLIAGIALALRQDRVTPNVEG